MFKFNFNLTKNFIKNSNKNIRSFGTSSNTRLYLSSRYCNNSDSLKWYTNELHKYAVKHKGFIKAESFWCNDSENESANKINLKTFSLWQNSNDFNKWLESKERKEILEAFNNMDIFIEEKHELLKKIYYNEIFLL